MMPPTNFCGGYLRGETQDYLLTILPTCPTPTSFTTTAVTTNGAQLTWASVGDGIRYDLQWKPQGSANWRTVSNLSQSTYELTGLQPGMTYSWQVRTGCSTVLATTYSSPATFTTTNTCLVPASLTVAGLTISSAILSWTANGPGIDYTLYLLACGSCIFAEAEDYGLTVITSPCSTFFQH